MKTPLLFLLFLLLSFVNFSQQVSTNAALEEVLVSASDALKTPEKALSILEAATFDSASDSLNAEGWRIRGLAHYYQGQFDSALVSLSLAQGLTDSSECDQQAFRIANALAVMLHSKKLISEALPHYMRAIRCAEVIGEEPSQAKVFNNLGVLYREYGQYELAHTYTKRALAIYERLDHTADMAGTLNNLGQIYLAQERLDSAETLFARSIAWKKEAGDLRGLANSFNNIGLVYVRSGRPSKALSTYREAMRIREKVGDIAGLASIGINMAEVFIQAGELDSAEKALNKVDSLSVHLKAKDIAQRYMLQMARLADARGQHKSAVNYLNEHLQIRDELLVQNNEQEMLRIRYATALNEALVRSAEAKQQDVMNEAIIMRQRTINLILAIGLAIFIGLLSLLFYQLRQLANLRNQLLMDRDRNKRYAESRKQALDQLSREIRTPLQGIITLTEMLESGQDLGEARKLGEVVRASGIRLLHNVNNLLNFARVQEGKLQPRCSSVNIIPLIESLLPEFEQLAEQKGLKLHVEFGASKEAKAYTDPAFYTFILTNLIGNAIAYTTQGEVSLTIEQRGETCLTTVRDTGSGIEEDRLEDLFQPFSKPHASGTGLGLFLAKRFAKSIKGELTMETQLGKGTQFGLELPATAADETHL